MWQARSSPFVLVPRKKSFVNRNVLESKLSRRHHGLDVEVLGVI